MANLSNINNKFLVTTGGNVLIGQTSAVGSSIFQVTGNSTFTGNVGIGISPNQNFHIFKSDATALIQASNTSGIAQLQFFPRDSSNVAHLQSIKGVDSNLTFLTGGNSGNSYVPTERMRIDSSGNVSIGTDTPLYLYSEQDIAQVAVNRVSSNGTIIDTSRSAAYINLNASNGGSSMTFHTANANNTAPPERMRIDSSGNVGIGTTSPAAGSQLTLRSSASTGMTILSASNTGECFINFSDNDDANVGQIFYGHSPDRMAFRVGDDTRMTILGSNGNVGIGTTSPSQLLHVNSSTNNPTGIGLQNSERYYSVRSNNFSLVFTDETVGSERMRIDSSGNVGIGATDARVRLEIEGAGQTTANITDSGNSGAFIQASDTGNGFGAGGGILFSATNDLGTRTPQAAIKSLLQNGGSQGIGDLAFSTRGATAATTLTERMRITSAGNVGIGTTSPGYQLDVSSSARITNELWLNSSGQSSLVFQQSSNSKYNIAYNTSGYLQFYNYVAGGTSMVINNSGNVGIGTTSPSFKLDVESSTDSLAGVYIQAGKSSWGEIQNTGLIVGSRTDMATNDYLGISFSGNAAVPARGRAAIGVKSTNGTSAMDLVFMTRSAADGTQLGSADEKMRITSGGDVLVNSATAFSLATHDPDVITTESFGVNNGSNVSTFGLDRIHFDSSNYFVLNAAAVGVKLVNGGTAWTAQSDEKLKENIKPLENVLDKIKDYRCVEYNLKANNNKKIGFIAQDWENDFAPIVNKDDEGLLGMKYTETIPVLLKAIQELKADNDSLKARIETLENN